LKRLLLAGTGLALLIPVIPTAAAQDAGSVDDIVVTGEKAPHTLRDTASSVDVTSDDEAERMGDYTTNDLLDGIPNIVTTEPGNSAPAVRGVDGTGPASGADAFFAGTRPRLNYQVDGRTLGYNEALYQDTTLWDIDQVEVYRGPQSTLQGRNAIAGTIVIRTADPTFDWEGRARALVGNQGERQYSGALGGPIASGLAAFRLSADWRRSQSFVPFEAYPEDAHPGRYQDVNLRGKLLLTPASNVRSLWTLSYLDGRAPQSAFVKWPYEGHVAALPLQPVFRSRDTTGISDTSWRLSDVLTLEAYLAATDFRTDRYSPVGQGNARIDGKEYVVEPFVRLRSIDDRFNGFLSAYIFRTHQAESIDLFGGGTFKDQTQTTAVFGEGNARLTDRLKLTLGARYEEEHRFRRGTDGPFVIDFEKTYKEFLPKATLAFDVSHAVTIGATVGRGYNAGGAGFTYSAPYVSYTYKPEFAWNYEGFLRSSLGNHWSATANVFYNDYKGLQLPFQLGINSTVIRNADKATTYGAEAGVSWRSKGNAFFANIGLLKTDVNRFADSGIQGNDLPRSPAFTSDVGATFSPDGKLQMTADVRYTDAYYSEATNDPRGRTSPYAVVNGQLAYPVGPVRLTFTVRNLLDSAKPVSIGPGATPQDYSATILQPRSVTGGVEVRF